MNITSIKTELMTICIGLILALNNINSYYITIITDSLIAMKKNLNLDIYPYQSIIISFE